jgi:benzylsuccinate CoA-transferase BbsE subunit
VERPGGDSSRNLGPFETDSPHPEQSLFFQYANTNKLGITLDIEHPEGQKIFARLLKKADVVVETFPPGYLENISLGFDKLKELNPKIILVSVTGFGQDGPRRHYKACDLVAAAFGGQMSVSGLPSKPLKPFGEQSYYTASLFGAIAILLALRKRKRTGRGEHIDLSLQESVVATLEHVVVRYFSEGVIPKREGSLHWNRSFCILSCKDGHILMTPFLKWETLVEWLEGEGMAEDLPDKKYIEEEYRRRHFAHIQDVLQKWTKTHTVQELSELAQTMRFPWAPIESPGKVLENPHLRARDFFGRIQTQQGRTLLYPRGPYKGFAVDLRKRAPRVGEDNDPVYKDLLGLSDQEIARLAKQKVM